MRTTLDLDGELVKEALKLTGFKKKTHLIEEALREIIQKMKRRKIVNQFGKLRFDPKILKLRHER